MKRDMELVRKILEHVQEHDEKSTFKIDGYDQVLVVRHVRVLVQAKLLVAEVIEADGTFYAVGSGDTHLTWEGHEFLDAAANPTVWERTKTTIREQGGAMAFSVVKELVMQYARESVGLK